MGDPIRLAEEAKNSHPPASTGNGTLRCELLKRRQSDVAEFLLDASFEAGPGFTIVFGSSGAGKTTLLDCVAGLVKPDSGRISVGSRVLFESKSDVDIHIAKRRVGYVLQDLALFPHLTVEQNVAYGLSHLSASKRVEHVRNILSSFHIMPLRTRKAREISGGERQRTALARTLVTDPEVLLLDEPLAALDTATKSQIIGDLREWNRSHRIPILYVTHNCDEVFALGERVLVLEHGRIIVEGTPHEVMLAPMQETVAQLVGFENVFDAIVDSVHPERGTMTCRLTGGDGPLSLETPLVRGGTGTPLRVGIRAGDILLATSAPVGLSARNVIPGRIQSLEQRDVIVCARVKCRVSMEVHLTLAARDSLQLAAGREVWLVIKTHSCHLMQR